MPGEFSITNKTAGTLPRLPFLDMKNDILGKDYSLSIAMVGKKTSREINLQYRGKDKPTNILSFAMRKNEGELVLCPEIIRKEAPVFNKTFPQFLRFLVIHGMLHLEGMRHGSRMEEAEKFYSQKYDKKHLNRNRRGLVHDEGRGRRISKGRKRS